MKFAKASFGLIFLLLVGFLTFESQPGFSRLQTGDQPSRRVQRELDFPSYSLRGGFSSLLQLVSDSPAPFSFRISVHSFSGQTVVAPPMTIHPQEKLSIDMQTLLTQLGVDRDVDFEEGSISVSYILEKSPLLGQVTISNPTSGIVYESLMAENDPGHTDLPESLEGLWWGLTPGREARAMATNTSSATVTADVYMSFGGQRHTSSPLVFGPHETKVLSIEELLAKFSLRHEHASEGGITIVGRGTPAALIATGMMADRATGFSTTMHFMLMGMPKTSTLYASGVPIGTPSGDSPFAGAGVFTPHVVVRNLISSVQTATITIEYPSGSGSQELTLAPLTLAAYSTKDLSLDKAVLEQLPLPLPFCSIRVQYSGPPGSAIAEVSSVEQNRNLVLDSKLGDPGDPKTGSGINPWHLDDQTEAVLFLTNAGDAPARIGFQIQADGVHYYLTNLKLNPHETRAIDIRKLRDDQQADFKGSKIPPNATDGSLVWIRLDKVPVVGRLLVFDSRRGISSNFDCTSVCTFHCPTGYYSLAVSPSSVTLLAGASQQFTATEAYGDCYGTLSYYNVTFGALWQSSDTSGSICTVNAAGVATAQAPGSATITATYTDSKPKWFVADQVCNDNYITKSASGTVTVTPTVAITSANSFAFVGSDPTIPQVVMQAVGNPSGGTYSWTASPANRVSFDNPNTDVVKLKGIDASTGVSDTTLTVNYTLNGQNAIPATRAITVRIFKFVILKTTTQAPLGNNFGYDFSLTYDVYTNPGGQLVQPGFSGISVPEVVTVVSTNIPGATTHTGGGFTDPNSEFTDRLALISNTPLPQNIDEIDSQDIFVGGFFVRNNTLHYTSTTVTVTNNGPTS